MKISCTFKLLILFYYYFSIIYCFNEQCSSKDNPKCSESEEKIYSEDANTRFKQYLKEYKEAQQSYKACDKPSCNCYLDVIHNDLKPFRKGISKDMIANIKTRGTKYQVIGNRLYRDKECMFPARCSGIEYFLLKLRSKLPDLEFIVNTRDWPQVHKEYGIFGPVFSFSKTKVYYDIMYPAWAFWEGGPAIGLYPTGIGKWSEHRQEIAKVANATKWNSKVSKAFFRGSRTSAERDPLILLSREQPELVDAQYTKNQAWKSDADTLYAPPASEVSFTEHCKYKYLFNFRGVAASFRFKHILLCKSLVFHVGDEWIEFFYPMLKPWVHYIPVGANASKDAINLLLQFARDNDTIAKIISENGYNMIWNNLKIKTVVCYWRKLLQNYAKLLKYQPELDNNLIEIV